MSMVMELSGGGQMKLWEDGGRIFFSCRCPLYRDGLYKVWVQGDGGEMILGTLTPGDGALLLSRAITVGELRRCGCWPVRSARCGMVYPFRKQTQDEWCWEERPQRLVDDETRELGEWSRMLSRRQGEWLELAWPVGRNGPIPLAHLFCLACVRRIRGEPCLVWRFDAEGRPCLPE